MIVFTMLMKNEQSSLSSFRPTSIPMVGPTSQSLFKSTKTPNASSSPLKCSSILTATLRN